MTGSDRVAVGQQDGAGRMPKTASKLLLGEQQDEDVDGQSGRNPATRQAQAEPGRPGAPEASRRASKRRRNEQLAGGKGCHRIGVRAGGGCCERRRHRSDGGGTEGGTGPGIGQGSHPARRAAIRAPEWGEFAPEPFRIKTFDLRTGWRGQRSPSDGTEQRFWPHRGPCSGNPESAVGPGGVPRAATELRLGSGIDRGLMNVSLTTCRGVA